MRKILISLFLLLAGSALAEHGWSHVETPAQLLFSDLEVSHWNTTCPDRMSASIESAPQAEMVACGSWVQPMGFGVDRVNTLVSRRSDINVISDWVVEIRINPKTIVRSYEFLYPTGITYPFAVRISYQDYTSSTYVAVFDLNPPDQ